MAQSSLFEEELEALQAIYMDDLIVSISNSCETILQITLHPSTADDVDKKFVCLTLICHIQPEYPEKVPNLFVKNPRGISDAHLMSIEENLAALSKQKIGEVMLFDLLQYAKDSLTDNNHPSCACPICLEYFKEEEKFFRTECYHYYHFPCIKGYISSNKEQHVCPVCRYEIQTDDVAVIIDHVVDIQANRNQETQIANVYMSTKQYKDWLNSCKVMFEKQKKNGGIIDLEYEKNKYLISAETNFTLLAGASESTELSGNTNRNSESTVKKKPYFDKRSTNMYGKSLSESSASQEGKCECPKSDRGKSRSHHRKPPRKYEEKSGKLDPKNSVSKTTDPHFKPHRKKTDRPQKENRGNGVNKSRQEHRKRERNAKEIKKQEPVSDKAGKVNVPEKPDEKPLKVESTPSAQIPLDAPNSKKVVRPPPGFKPLT